MGQVEAIWELFGRNRSSALSLDLGDFLNLLIKDMRQTIRSLTTIIVLASFLLSGCVNKSTAELDVPEEKGPKWGFIDHSGRFVIKPTFYRVKRFTEGLAAADLHTRWGYIDREGNWVIERTYSDCKNFSAGYAAVESDGKWGAINKKGTVVFPITQKEVGIPHEVDPDAEDHAVLLPYKDEKSGKWGFHDFGPHGKGPINPQWDEVKYFNDGLCPVSKMARDKDGNPIAVWGYCNNKGEIVIDFKFASASVFRNRVAECTMGDDFVWVDKIGTIAKKSRLESTQLFRDGLALQEKKKGFIYIKRDGKPAFRKRFRYADNFSEGLAWVQPKNSSKFGYIDTQGEFIIPPIYDEARAFSEQLAAVKVDPDEFFKRFNEDGTPKPGTVIPGYESPSNASGPAVKDGEKSEDGKSEDGKSEDSTGKKGESDSATSDEGTEKSEKKDEKGAEDSESKSESKSKSKSDSDDEGGSESKRTEEYHEEPSETGE